jgi:hypothetical protein
MHSGVSKSATPWAKETTSKILELLISISLIGDKITSDIKTI